MAVQPEVISKSEKEPEQVEEVQLDDKPAVETLNNEEVKDEAEEQLVIEAPQAQEPEKAEASPLSLGFGSSHDQADEDCDQPPDDIPPSPSEDMNAESKAEVAAEHVAESTGEEAGALKEASVEHEAPVEDAAAKEILEP